MRRISIVPSMLLLTSVSVVGQTPPPESQIAQATLAEIRQLRNDWQIAAVTIQRVQIVVYRLQSQTAVLERATQRMKLACAACEQAQE